MPRTIMSKPSTTFASLALLFVATSCCADSLHTDASQSFSAATWPQLRGQGGLAVADDTPILADFGPQKHVLWKAEVPPGHSSPCIWGDRLFITGFEDGKNVIVALDRASGARIWERTFEGESHPQYYHADAVPALPTPCTDGERLIAYLGDYGLVALDFDGNPIWERRMPHPGYGFGIGTSPILAGGNVIVMRDGAPEAAVLAIDAASGEETWKIDRFDYQESHGTPFLWRNADRDELVISGSRRLCSYDVQSGAELWNVEGTTAFPCTTATGDADTVYFAAWSTPNATGRSFWEATFGRSIEVSDAEIDDPKLLFDRLDTDHDGHVTNTEVPECRAKDAFGFVDRDQSGTWEVEEFVAVSEPSGAPGKNIMLAVDRGGEGDVSGSHVRWTWTRGLPYVASPLLYRGRLWLVKSGGIVTCLDADTGKPVFDRERLPDRSEYYVSPVGASGFILIGTEAGTLFVIDATSDELKVIHSANFDEALFATPAVLDGRVYLRSTSTVWAFGSAGGLVMAESEPERLAAR